MISLSISDGLVNGGPANDQNLVRPALLRAKSEREHDAPTRVRSIFLKVLVLFGVLPRFPELFTRDRLKDCVTR